MTWDGWVHPASCKGLVRQREFFDALAYAERNGFAEDAYEFARHLSESFPECDCRPRDQIHHNLREAHKNLREAKQNLRTAGRNLLIAAVLLCVTVGLLLWWALQAA